ncbi:hypothetical protein ACFV4F_38960 [Kitasatospora sp. NPDC059722]|uniref:hypothetical protein n=1 Tax=unclassified Kitasatospora TaxID=2633591 RepID=UPI0036542826
MTGRYTIIPADTLNGASYPVWVVRDHKTGTLVKALPPADSPLRFYSYHRARTWVARNERSCPDMEHA